MAQNKTNTAAAANTAFQFLIGKVQQATTETPRKMDTESFNSS